ncbi:thioesterase family protein [Pseudonocardia nematodicida]|uniref:Thioesterase family protein n=1 Tax=Pseudonocardia nematodicida TaxID=1206997 RepID=A0ABV1KIG0_9PSEU
MTATISTQTTAVPEAGTFPILVEHEARYADLDASRRIGRDALVRWFEDARVAVEHDAFGADLQTRMQSQVGILLAAIKVDVLAPLTVAGRYRIGVGVSHIGTTSFSYSYAVFSGDDVVATAESTSVLTEDGRPAPLPDDVRTALDGIRIDAPAPTRPERGDARRVRENYPFRWDVRTRFSDIDTNRHVNNVALASWYLDGLAELHTDVLGYPAGGPLDGLSPSSLSVQYLAQVQYPGIYQLRVAVEEIGEDTVRYVCGLFDGRELIGLAEAEGFHHAPGEDGDPVRLAEALAPFRFKA